MYLPKRILEQKLLRFLKEDIGQGDITTYLIIPANTKAEAEIITKEAGIVAGIEEALALCKSCGIEAEALTDDGVEVRPGIAIMRLIGDARGILSLERTLLNLLSRMSGIATMTKRLVRKIGAAGCKTRVASTRKVGPGLAYFDKKAVFLGDGDTHRLHLDDLVLVKDNHIKIAGSIERAIKESRNAVSFSKKVEVEVASAEEALQAAKAGADIIMLDNFPPHKIKKTISLLEKEKVRTGVMLEASGGITEKSILEYVSTGVDIVSIGAITHSVKALNMNLEVVKVEKGE